MSYINIGVCGGAVGWCTVLQAGRSRVRFPTVAGIFHWHNPSGCTMALGLTQPLTEMSKKLKQALRVPGGWGSQILRQSAHEGGKVVSPMHWPRLLPGNIPGTHFCYRLNRPQGHSVTGRIMSIKKSSDTIRNRTHDLSGCSAMPQPLRHRVPQQKWVPGIIPGPVRRADLTTFICWLSWNLGASTSWNHMGLSRPVMGLLCYLSFRMYVFYNLC
jgi:hypothetical protein